ncbi:MAG: hypothetical protein IJ646_13340 [Clostridia bacterium]|nr:hypothetical protein [Clostridia bacterium]
MAKTWAQETIEELNAKGRENWTPEDWEAYSYICCVNAESDYYNSLD